MVIKKGPVVNFSTISNSSKEIFFFFEISKFFQQFQFFSVYLRSLLFSNCQLARFKVFDHFMFSSNNKAPFAVFRLYLPRAAQPLHKNFCFYAKAPRSY